MLHLYEGEDNLPTNREYIHDVESEFYFVGIVDCMLARQILKEIEQADYVDKSRFKDRFGNLLYLDDLSTSTKALLTLIACKDKVLNFNEVGVSAVDFALQHFTEGYIFLNRYYSNLDYGLSVDIIVNDEEYFTLSDDFNEEWGA